MKSFKSGEFISQNSFKCFFPKDINRKWTLDDIEIINLLSSADRELGKLDMYSEYIPNIDLFIGMHVVKEANQSSKIEGTKTNIEDAFLDKEDVSEEKKDDWEEVQNYISALNKGITSLEEIPLSSRLIKQSHKILMKGVRGKHKIPGEFRTSQNWIGGASISDAVFVPPPHNEISSLMGDLENFTHNREILLPGLLKIALIHYQFETIHPFLDGNGRVGRLMITLFLVEKGLLKKPILYLSDFFERHKKLYYDNLMNVRTHGDLKQWFKFFLVGVIETAKNSIQTFDNILKLQKEIDQKIQCFGARSGSAREVINKLFNHPFIDAQRVCDIIKVSPPSAYKLINDLEELEIIKEYTGGKRGKKYCFNNYIELFK